MILHDQLPNSPKNRQNGKTTWSHTKEIVQKHNKKCLQQKNMVLGAFYPSLFNDRH
jgi:hypothetical protein